MTERTQTRLQEIRRRTQIKRRRQEERILSVLTICSLLLVTAIGGVLRQLQLPGISAVESGYSSVLLRNGAGAYIVVGIAAFVVGVVLTLICIRWKKRDYRRHDRIRYAEEKEDGE